MKKSWLWILILLIVALALWGVKGTMNKGADLVKGVTDTAGDLAGGAVDVVKDGADMVGDAGKAVVDGAADVAGWAVDVVKDAGEAVADGAWAVVDGAADVAKDAGDAVVDGAKAVVDGAGDAVEWAADMAKDAGNAVVDGAKEVVEGAAEAVEDTAGAVKEAMDDDAVKTGESEIRWTGRTWPKKHNGIIAIKSWKLDTDDGKITGGEFVIDMSTIKATDIDSKKLDDHLKAEDFFDVANYPTSMLKITEVDGNTLTADLTIKGTTLPVTFDVVMKDGVASTKFSIDSSKWGVVEGIQDAIVADDIDLDIALAY